MKNKHMFFTVLSIAIVPCLLFLLTGCSEKSAPQQKKVFSQKIGDEKAELPNELPEIQTPQIPQLSGLPKEISALAAEKKIPPIEAKTEEAADEEKLAKPAAPVANDDKAVEKTPPSKTYAYDPKGKIDPFLPWTAGAEDASGSGNQVKRRIPRTPLEKVDLSQLKLVGVILSASGNKALVEETTGKGFVITQGTYIGINGGKVSKILKDKVIVEEVVNYGISGTSVLTRELKLQKPPGEE